MSDNDSSSRTGTDACALCGKREDLLMCNACQDRYKKKMPHRNLTACARGHLREKCPNSLSYRRTGSAYDCCDESDHCAVCEHNVPYGEYLAFLQTNVVYSKLLEKYMDTVDACRCWYCVPCQ